MLPTQNSEEPDVFPKARLYKAGSKRSDVNAIANFAFLTQDTNLTVSDHDPAEYIPEYEAKNPGTIATHWIPMDPELWKIEDYLDFLAERRRLLAQAANEQLERLRTGEVPEQEAKESVFDRIAAEVPGGIEGECEERRLRKCNDWVIAHGLPAAELRHELVDETTGEPLANLDLAWPNGLQEGLSQPVALLPGEGPELEQVVEAAGFRFFTSVKNFRSYVRREVPAEEKESPFDNVEAA